MIERIQRGGCRVTGFGVGEDTTTGTGPELLQGKKPTDFMPWSPSQGLFPHYILGIHHLPMNAPVGATATTPGFPAIYTKFIANPDGLDNRWLGKNPDGSVVGLPVTDMEVRFAMAEGKTEPNKPIDTSTTIAVPWPMSRPGEMPAIYQVPNGGLEIMIDIGDGRGTRKYILYQDGHVLTPDGNTIDRDGTIHMKASASVLTWEDVKPYAIAAGVLGGVIVITNLITAVKK